MPPDPTRDPTRDPTDDPTGGAPADPTAALVRRTLDAWFADPADDRLDVPRTERWFGGGRALDAALADGFGDAIDAAARGEHDAALANADGALALVVLLDQFPRNVHRGDARAFAYGEHALAMAGLARARGHAARLPLVARVFLALPWEHDESAVSQARAIDLLEEVAREADAAVGAVGSAGAAADDERERAGRAEAIATFARGALDSAREHAAIVERFGRYPYRNAVLGRTSTPEERRWLEAGPKRFGQ